MPARQQKLSRADVGAWVLKGNPQDTWDYFAALEDEGGRGPGEVWEGTWTVGRTYRTHLIEPGDLMVLWVTGTKNPGIYEIGKVTRPPEEIGGIDDVYLVDTSLANKPTFAVPNSSVLLKSHIPRAAMKADPVLALCEQFVIPIIGNPTYLTPEQRDALLPFISVADRQAAGWPTRKPRGRR